MLCLCSCPGESRGGGRLKRKSVRDGQRHTPVTDSQREEVSPVSDDVTADCVSLSLSEELKRKNVRVLIPRPPSVYLPLPVSSLTSDPQPSEETIFHSVLLFYILFLKSPYGCQLYKALVALAEVPWHIWINVTKKHHRFPFANMPVIIANYAAQLHNRLQPHNWQNRPTVPSPTASIM